ncbi:MAG: flagellar export protein FliJ [Planctomycetaceae bacterium]|nr:flagellar export protein FliJ [Planctomycetaceae bacterium]
MKFKYRLAPLLKIRENVRAERQTELSKAYEAARIVEEELQRVQSELVRNNELGREAIQKGQISVDYLLSLRRHEAFLLTQQSQAQEQLEQIRQEIERRRVALMEADREVKVLEKLREKMKFKHLQEEALAELKQMDEIAGRVRKKE